MYAALKRASDIALALVGLVIFAPLMLAVAIAIRLTMNADPLFRQVRAGQGGRTFTLYKFRTMRDRPDRGGRPLPREERLTPLSRFLRRTGIDELPQLWNVIRGEMSLIGPRPLYVQYLPVYTERERKRFLVRPGITGLAQVAERDGLSWDERLELDAQYVERLSLWLDLYIVLKTVALLVRGRGPQPTNASWESLIEHRRKGTAPGAPRDGQ